jgi:hypothetical protein
VALISYGRVAARWQRGEVSGKDLIWAERWCDGKVNWSEGANEDIVEDIVDDLDNIRHSPDSDTSGNSISTDDITLRRRHFFHQTGYRRMDSQALLDNCLKVRERFGFGIGDGRGNFPFRNSGIDFRTELE